MRSLIIDKAKLKQKIIRLAYEIVEDQFEEDEICLVGIKDGGYQVANILKKEIQKIKAVEVSISSLQLNKANPLVSPAKLSKDISYFEGKAVIIVDDVANSGRTIFYAFQHFLNIIPKTVKVAVLVDRKHKKFPVHCNYVGTSLGTTIKEHIEVVFNGTNVEAAYLE